MMENLLTHKQYQQYFLPFLEFVQYHLISEIIILITVIIILIHYYGSKKNRIIAINFQTVLMPLISKWFRKNDGELVY